LIHKLSSGSHDLDLILSRLYQENLMYVIGRVHFIFDDNESDIFPGIKTTASGVRMPSILAACTYAASFAEPARCT
jgi:hypothetical protein